MTTITPYEQATEMMKSHTGIFAIYKDKESTERVRKDKINLMMRVCNCYEITHNINRRTENKKVGMKGKTRWFIENCAYKSDGELKPLSVIEFCVKKKGEYHTPIYGTVWVIGEKK